MISVFDLFCPQLPKWSKFELRFLALSIDPCCNFWRIFEKLKIVVKVGIFLVFFSPIGGQNNCKNTSVLSFLRQRRAQSRKDSFVVMDLRHFHSVTRNSCHTGNERLPGGGLETWPLPAHSWGGPKCVRSSPPHQPRSIFGFELISFGQHLQELCAFVSIFRVGWEGGHAQDEEKDAEHYRKPHFALQGKFKDVQKDCFSYRRLAMSGFEQ